MRHHQLDTSRELLVQRWMNGIRLVRPERDSTQMEAAYSVADILHFPQPLVVYFYNTESAFQQVNEALAVTNGFVSAQDAIGKTMFAVAKRKCAEQFIANNIEVMKNNKIKIIEEHLRRKDDIDMLALTIKSPWYNETGNIIGVFGCSLVLGAQPLADSLLQVAKTGLLDAKGFSTTTIFPGLDINGTYLSTREKECLYFCIRGKSANEIAKVLGLSKRTIENYLANIKTKLGVSSKSELIDKMIDYFLKHKVEPGSLLGFSSFKETKAS